MLGSIGTISQFAFNCSFGKNICIRNNGFHVLPQLFYRFVYKRLFPLELLYWRIEITLAKL